MSVIITNNRIDGLRVTVYDVLHYLEAGRSQQEIMDILPLTLKQVEAAVRHIDQHREEVSAVHRRIEDRIERGNPPQIEASARAGRARMQALQLSDGSANGKGGGGEGTAG